MTTTRRPPPLRSIGGLVALLAVVLVAQPVVPASAAPPVPIVVTTTSDGVPGSLRAAVDQANAQAGPDTIVLGDHLDYRLTVCGSRDDANITGDLQHRGTDTLTIDGNGSTISQTCPAERAIEGEWAAGTLELTHLRIAGAPGGAVKSAGAVTLFDVHLVGNGSISSNTGGVVARDLLVMDSTIEGNVGWESGALTFFRGLVLQNSTVVGNHPGGVDGIAYPDDAAAVITHATIVDNAGFDLGLASSRYADLSGTLAASAVGTCAPSSNIVSAGNNASLAADCGFDDPSDQPGLPDLGLGPLGDHGGGGPTALPLVGSPLRDAIANCLDEPFLDLDQRGAPRPMGAGCDIGAAEADGPLPLPVTSKTDGAPGSLRAAVDAANAAAGPDVIRIDPSLVPGVTLDVCGPAEDANASGDLDSTDAAGLTLLGEGVTVTQTCGSEQVLTGAGPVVVKATTLDGGGLTAASAEVVASTVRDSADAGIAVTEGATVERSTIEDNAGPGVVSTAACDGVEGISIVASTISGNEVGATGPWVVAQGSTVTGNGPGPVGGGLVGASLVQVVNSTVHDNEAVTGGGGLTVAPCGSSGSAFVQFSTVTANRAPSGANLVIPADSGGVLLGSVIAEGGGGGTDCDLPFVIDVGGNLDGDGSCQLLHPDSLSAVGDPLLGALGDHGGPTATRVPLPGSPLLQAVWGCTGDGPDDAAHDQRGVPRAQGAWCDAGAVEVEQAPTFSDVSEGTPFFHEVECLASLGITEGYADGSYRPWRTVTRQAVAAWLWRLEGEPTPSGPPPFADVPADHPFADAIAWMAEAGLADGYPDGGFHPGDEVTRQAVAAFLWRLAGEPAPTTPPDFGDVPPTHPFADAIAWMAEEELADGYPDGTFRPTGVVRRAPAAAFLCRFEHDQRTA